MNDFQMARGHNDGWRNLAVGEPFFLQKHLKFIHEQTGAGAMTYPLTDGQPELLEELRNIHGKDAHIVVANGAKHALLASFYAMSEWYGVTRVHHSTPYWPSYPTLAKLSNLGFSSAWREANIIDSIKVITAPNNPDSSEYSDDCDIWDAVYAHAVYGHTVVPSHRIGIFSASKSVGMSGMRVGWAVFKDPGMAKSASMYVEITTSGVSAYSQRYVANALKFMRENKEVTADAYREARYELVQNATTFNIFLAPHCAEVRGLPDTEKGMFAWFKVKDQVKFEAALKETKTRLVSGEACGVSEPGWYRMNCGLDKATFTEYLSDLSKELSK
jgi:aspartate/methionine/tyrosine aminotransferase